VDGEQQHAQEEGEVADVVDDGDHRERSTVLCAVEGSGACRQARREAEADVQDPGGERRPRGPSSGLRAPTHGLGQEGDHREQQHEAERLHVAAGEDLRRAAVHVLGGHRGRVVTEPR
jgi:hypothetical protein